jgi:hypothetical protein
MSKRIAKFAYIDHRLPNSRDINRRGYYLITEVMKLIVSHPFKYFINKCLIYKLPLYQLDGCTRNFNITTVMQSMETPENFIDASFHRIQQPNACTKQV